MPFFDLDPIDPDLELGGDIGPGRANRLEDRVKLASAIEKKTGAAPHADLGRFGETLAQRFADRGGGQPGGQPGGRRGDALSPGFLGAVGAAQIRRGTDPDTVVLKDGPTRDALKSKGGRGTGGPGTPDLGGTFAPLPKIDRPVGPPLSRRAPNRPPNSPKDARALQGKLASLGYVPRVTEKPLFPGNAAGRPSTPPFTPSGGGTVPDAGGGLQTLLDAVAAFQRNKRLKEDRLVNPGGPTERALDAQNEKARRARLDRLNTVSREIMDSGAPEYAPITDRSAADTLAGLVVANEVQDQREERLAELEPLSFQPQRLPDDAPSTRRDSGGGIVLAQRRIGGGGPRGGNSDPTTHGNRLGRRIRERRAQRELEKKKAQTAEQAKDFISQIPDGKIRGVVTGMLKGANARPKRKKDDNEVIFEKKGGYRRAVSDFLKAVHEAGGAISSLKIDKPNMRRFTAADGTEIMYRRFSTRHERTNEIHIRRPGRNKASIKIRYPD